ncbi:hypothetical protein AYI69_g4560 [Smittium culicis]|uniref:Reverse transcriptase domain-containing protein n=1 Tax=Smittium culicis TaxID=133412 RepID=A0A1R1YCP0_9FUNG|nr:hypothetical protein AYI69_g4560 [Smittium culicis]
MLFTITKKTGSLRPFLDLRKLNLQVSELNFKIENLSSTFRLIHRKELSHILRSSGAFIHILIFKKCRKYHQFHWDDCCFQFHNLPFGLSLIPLIFTKILRPVPQ